MALYNLFNLSSISSALDDVDSKNLTRQVSEIRKDSVPPSLLARVKELPEEEELEGDN